MYIYIYLCVCVFFLRLLSEQPGASIWLRMQSSHTPSWWVHVLVGFFQVQGAIWCLCTTWQITTLVTTGLASSPPQRQPSGGWSKPMRGLAGGLCPERVSFPRWRTKSSAGSPWGCWMHMSSLHRRADKIIPRNQRDRWVLHNPREEGSPSCVIPRASPPWIMAV